MSGQEEAGWCSDEEGGLWTSTHNNMILGWLFSKLETNRMRPRTKLTKGFHHKLKTRGGGRRIPMRINNMRACIDHLLYANTVLSAYIADLASLLHPPAPPAESTQGEGQSTKFKGAWVQLPPGQRAPPLSLGVYSWRGVSTPLSASEADAWSMHVKCVCWCLILSQ